MVKEKREIIFFISELLTYCGDRRRARRKGRIERGTLGLFYVCVKKNQVSFAFSLCLKIHQLTCRIRKLPILTNKYTKSKSQRLERPSQSQLVTFLSQV